MIVASLLAIPALRGVAPRMAFAASADRMQWWREARFGLFLHWGLYSILAGKWHDDERWAEWIRNNAEIPVGEYDKLLERWNPTAFDPDAWAAMAQRAGMKYVVLTTKHHDGFCLYDSPASNFDVMRTPSKRDICRELAPALRKRGIRVGWYHSIMDWHHPDYLPRRKWEEASRPVGDADVTRYLAYLTSSLDHLLGDYGDIDIVWFDGQWEATWTHELAKSLQKHLRTSHPTLIMNDRINGAGTPRSGRLGDFGTPELKIPATGTPGKDWESCMTMNENWGFKAADHKWKSPRTLVELLVETASKGGNLLLNVGPMGDGQFPPESVERLAAIGTWMDDHADTIHGTTASQFANATRFRSTTKGRQLHLFVTDWKAGPLPLPGLRVRPAEASLREKGNAVSPLKIVSRGRGYAVVLPENPPATLLPVVTLRFEERP